MDESKRYTRWEEVVVSTDKGRREVHYFLKDNCGNSDLAVVGRERSLRHMTYETADGFLRSCHVESPSPHCSPLTDGSMALKWKTRREVVDWLSSLVSDCTTYRSSPSADRFSDYDDMDPTDGPSSKIIITSSIPNQQRSRDFSWMGSSWTCRKRRKHYRSFCRRGITISVHDFVYIMTEENKRLVAYIDDLYEDVRENNMASVRWFHKTDEVGTTVILPSDVMSDREIFFSLCLQDLSVECIDGLACVFSPAHFDQFNNAESARPKHRLLYPYMCRRQIDNDDIMPFDITQLPGYWSQEALRSIFAPTSLKLRLKISTGKKRKRDAVNEEDVKAAGGKWQLLPGQHVEVLSQDSGIRGCWFRCVILRKHQDRIKVRYLDIHDADGTGKLEEWVWCTRIAALNDLGLRVVGRPTVRPTPSSERPSLSSDCTFEVGSMVDARWMDGWWEGIVIRCKSDEKIQVYFPGEKRVSIFASTQLRHSSEWVDDKWNSLKERKDIVASILTTVENSQNETSLLQEEMKSETLRELSSPTSSSPDLRKDLVLDGLKWSSRKRRRFSPNRVKRSPGSSSGCTQEETEPSACGSFVLLDSSDNENCNIGGDHMLFGGTLPVAAISNLVMSQ